MPFDPVSLGLGAAQTIGGLAQTLFSGKKKSEREYERYVDSYRKNPSIMDLYNKALARYNVNPYTSASYNSAMTGAGRGLTTGISGLQDRRSALAGIPALTQNYNDASLRAAANAEREQAQAVNQLSGATQLKAREDRYPYELKLALLGQKASGANAVKQAGWKNLFGGLGTALSGFSRGSGSSSSSSMPSETQYEYDNRI